MGPLLSVVVDSRAKHAVARVDSGWGVRERSELFFSLVFQGKKSLLASAAGASAAAAAAAAATALRTAGWSYSVFFLNDNSSAKAIWWWMLFRTLRKVTYEYEKKHVRSVGVYSGIMYGCVRVLDCSIAEHA